MRRYNRNSIRRERAIMITSAALVLSGLTLTGVYMSRNNNNEEINDGYSVDFAALESDTNDKLDEVAQNRPSYIPRANVEDDLDYMPMEPEEPEEIAFEVDSNLVEIAEEQENLIEENESVLGEIPEVLNEEVTLNFSEEIGRPVDGEVILPYSMSGSVYFKTLDQYKYNPAMIISAEAGEEVFACSHGKVVDIYENAELGQVMEIELGDGYRAIYGQLDNLKFAVDDYVNAGDVIATVASPTKYYSEEGSNIYFRMDYEGNPINPEDFF